MKIYYHVDIDKYVAEGRVTISNRIKKFLKERRYIFVDDLQEADLMHFHSSGILNSYTAYKLKKKYKKSCIYSLYSNSETSLFYHFRNYLAQRILLQKPFSNVLMSYTSIIPLKVRGIFLKKLDKVIVPTAILKKKLFDNTKVIHLGVDVNKFKPIKKSVNKKIKIGYFGYPSAPKGFLEFVNASIELSKHFEVYGFFTSLPKKVKKYIQRKNSKIKITGFIKDINKAYNEMDIIVLPYRSPLAAVANPLVLLEAMAAGKAIITTNLNFIKEIAKDNVILIKPYSQKKIVSSVFKLAKDKKLRENLGQRARKIVVKSYNQEKMFNEYLKIYKEFEKKNQKK